MTCTFLISGIVGYFDEFAAMTTSRPMLRAIIAIRYVQRASGPASWLVPYHSEVID